MRRRELLTSTGIVFTTGCISNAAHDSPQSSMENRISRVTAVIHPIDHVSLSANVVRQSDQDSPPQVSISVRNTSQAVRSFETGPSPPFDPAVANHLDGDGTLFVVPADGTGFEVPANDGEIETQPPAGDERLVPETPTDGCWVADNSALETYQMARGRSLDPGEVLDRSYVVLAHPDNEACLPSGRYRAVDTARVDGAEVTLEVTLEVE